MPIVAQGLSPGGLAVELRIIRPFLAGSTARTYDLQLMQLAQSTLPLLSGPFCGLELIFTEVDPSEIVHVASGIEGEDGRCLSIVHHL